MTLTIKINGKNYVWNKYSPNVWRTEKGNVVRSEKLLASLWRHGLKDEGNQIPPKAYYTEEHPDFIPPEDFDFEKLKAEGFEDMSWHNDAMPSFGHYKHGLALWVDYVEARSEFSEDDFKRYHLSKRELREGEKEHESLTEDSENVLKTNDFGEVLAYLKRQTIFVYESCGQTIEFASLNGFDEDTCEEMGMEGDELEEAALDFIRTLPDVIIILEMEEQS